MIIYHGFAGLIHVHAWTLMHSRYHTHYMSSLMFFVIEMSTFLIVSARFFLEFSWISLYLSLFGAQGPPNTMSFYVIFCIISFGLRDPNAVVFNVFIILIFSSTIWGAGGPQMHRLIMSFLLFLHIIISFFIFHISFYGAGSIKSFIF